MLQCACKSPGVEKCVEFLLIQLGVSYFTY